MNYHSKILVALTFILLGVFILGGLVTFGYALCVIGSVFLVAVFVNQMLNYLNGTPDDM